MNHANDYGYSIEGQLPTASATPRTDAADVLRARLVGCKPDTQAALDSILRDRADLIAALQDVSNAARACTNGRNITTQTRLLECGIIADAALARVRS